MRCTVLYLTIYFTSALAACTTRKDIEYAELKYAQTKCADKWAPGVSDAITAENVQHYLDSLGLAPLTVRIEADSPAELCNSCSCKTGKIIYVSTFANN